MSGRVLITGAAGALGRSVNLAETASGIPSAVIHLVGGNAVASAIHFLTTPAAAGINGAAVRVPGRSL